MIRIMHKSNSTLLPSGAMVLGFRPDADLPRNLGATLVLHEDMWRELGSPDTITVTIDAQGRN